MHFVKLKQGNVFLIRHCSQFFFCVLGPECPCISDMLHSLVVVCWICLEGDATSTNALEDGWVGGANCVRLNVLGK